MLATLRTGSQGSHPIMKILAKWAFVMAAAVAIPISGCATESHRGQSLHAESGNSGRPFGGAPAVNIPAAAYAMGAYLKAEVASEKGDRQEALKQYEEA